MKKFIAVALILCSLLILCSCQSEPREVRTARIDENGELVIYFTDGTKSTVGVVKGEKGDAGENGKDGVDGKDGENGKDGKDGEDGEEGQRGPAGLSGRSVADVFVGEGGNFIVTYSDSSTTEIALLGQLYLFGGKCGDNAYWGLYNGGILIIGGEGATDGYSESSPAPWSILIPMISAVVIDKTELNEAEGLLYGFDLDAVTVQRVEQYEVSYIDMTERAYVYDSESLENRISGIDGLPACSEIHIAERGEGYAKIILDGGIYGYIDIDYVRKGSFDSMLYDAPVGFTYVMPEGESMNLRSFPDASSSSNNIKATVSVSDFDEGGVLAGQTGILCTGVSRNGTWYRVAYGGMTLYVMSSVAEPVIE